MIWWLLDELLPLELIALVVLVALGLQFGGVDVFGFVMTNLVDPLLDWVAQEFTSNIWPW